MSEETKRRRSALAAAAALGLGVAVYFFARPAASGLVESDPSMLAVGLGSAPSFFHTVFVGFALLWADGRRRPGRAAWWALAMGMAFEALQATPVPWFGPGVFDPMDILAVATAALFIAAAGRAVLTRRHQ